MKLRATTTAIAFAAILASSSQVYSQSLRDVKSNNENAKAQCALDYENAQFLEIGYQGDIYNNHRVFIDRSGKITKVSKGGDPLTRDGGNSVSCNPEGRLSFKSEGEGRCTYSNGMYVKSYSAKEYHIEGNTLIQYYQSGWKDCSTGKFLLGRPNVLEKKYAPRSGYSYP